MREFLKKNFPSLIPIVRCVKQIPFIRYLRGKRSKYLSSKEIKSAVNICLENNTSKSSISDNSLYPLVCYLASKNEKVFSTFKQSRIYRNILEHVTEKLGREYLDVIKEIHPFNYNDWQEFSRNDLYGGTQKFAYDIDGKNFTLSPTTIRYAKVLGDILKYFDSENIKSIAEIGIGYGGQCRIIRSKIPGAVYNLFDLPEVIGLAEKFLTHYDECRQNIKYIDGGHIYFSENYDLVISNYAFSELRREVQDMYLGKIILRSKRGYITWNNLAQKSFGSYSINELLAKIPGSIRIDERPLTAPDNCIIIWGNK